MHVLYLYMCVHVCNVSAIVCSCYCLPGVSCCVCGSHTGSDDTDSHLSPRLYCVKARIDATADISSPQTPLVNPTGSRSLVVIPHNPPHILVLISAGKQLIAFKWYLMNTAGYIKTLLRVRPCVSAKHGPDVCLGVRWLSPVFPV